jgi:hypothetical protein
MSFGNNPADSASGKQHSDRFMAKADADRAARLAGRKPLFQRLLNRLRPHHCRRHVKTDPVSEPEN